jgi:RNA polymerase sigma-70 factor (ECF subfamily)
MDHSGPGVTSSDSDPTGRPSGGREDAALAARGDRRAFERLYRDNVARIHGLARRMIGPEVADEVTQDVFVRAWDKLGSFRGDSQFGTWLYRLAVNLILSKRAQLATRRSREWMDEEVLDSLPARAARPDLGLDFETAIQKLPEGARQIFVMHDIEGFRHEEIASMLGVTSGTSKAQLHRARMILRRVLNK